MAKKYPRNPVGKFFQKSVCAILISSQVLIAFLLSLFVIPLIAPLLFPFYAFRYIVFKLTPIFRPNMGKMLSSRSAMFASDCIYSKPLCTVVGRLIFEGPLDLERQRAVIQKLWIDTRGPNGQLMYPELTHYITYFCGFPFWKKDKHFKLEDHVQLMDKKFIKSLDGYATDLEIVDCMTHLGLEPFKIGNLKKSPWQVVLGDMVPGNNSQSKYTLILRWHHSLADALGMMKLFECLTNIDVKAIAETGNSRHSQKRKFFYPLCQVLSAPYDAIMGSLESRDPISLNSWHLPASKLKRTWSCAFSDEQFPKDLIKEIGSGFQVSFNAVIMAVIAGAVRELMLANPNRKMPNYIHAGVPFPTSGSHPDKLRNFWSICTVKLPVGEKSAIKRLHYVAHKLKSLKRSTLPITAFLMMPFVGSLFNGMVKLLMKNRNTTMILSVMPGPTKAIQNHFGEKVPEAGFLVSLGDGNTGFGMSVFTYDSCVQFGATIDHGLLRDPAHPKFEAQQLADNACKELKHLKTLIKTQV